MGKLNKYDLSHSYGIGYALNTGKPFYFDLEDFDKIKDQQWYESKRGYIYNFKNYLHRLVMQPKDNEEVDHIFHNKLDNRKQNLRLCTHIDNTKNIKLSPLNTSGYKGVSYVKESGKWRADIYYNKKRICLGRYQTKEEAHQAYVSKAKELFGEYYCER